MSLGQWKNLKRNLAGPGILPRLERCIVAYEDGDPEECLVQVMEISRVISGDGVIERIDDWTGHRGFAPAMTILTLARQSKETNSLPEPRFFDEARRLVQLLEPTRIWWS